MENKYYWLSYVRMVSFGEIFMETTSTDHPFKYISENNERYKENNVLTNWKEITKEEYDLYTKIFYKK